MCSTTGWFKRVYGKLKSYSTRCPTPAPTVCDHEWKTNTPKWSESNFTGEGLWKDWNSQITSGGNSRLSCASVQPSLQLCRHKSKYLRLYIKCHFLKRFNSLCEISAVFCAVTLPEVSDLLILLKHFSGLKSSGTLAGHWRAVIITLIWWIQS